MVGIPGFDEKAANLAVKHPVCRVSIHKQSITLSRKTAQFRRKLLENRPFIFFEPQKKPNEHT
jgi:hypothetical protein